MNLSTGIGTHMDAPSHVFPDGQTIDLIPLTQCHAPACVLHLADQVQDDSDYEISVNDILEWEGNHGSIKADTIVLADTGWGKYWGEQKFCQQDEKGTCHFPGFSKGAAKILVDRKIKGVGIDTLSIDTGNTTDSPAHSYFLKNKIIIVENLDNLERLPATGALVWILPMKIKGAPEAPVRAFAIL